MYEVVFIKVKPTHNLKAYCSPSSNTGGLFSASSKFSYRTDGGGPTLLAGKFLEKSFLQTRGGPNAGMVNGLNF